MGVPLCMSIDETKAKGAYHLYVRMLCRHVQWTVSAFVWTVRFKSSSITQLDTFLDPSEFRPLFSWHHERECSTKAAESYEKKKHLLLGCFSLGRCQKFYPGCPIFCKLSLLQTWDPHGDKNGPLSFGLIGTKCSKPGGACLSGLTMTHGTDTAKNQFNFGLIYHVSSQ